MTRSQLTLAGTGQTKWTAGFSADGRSIAWGSTFRQDNPTNRGPFQFQLRLPTATERLGSPEPIGPAEAADASRWRRASASQGEGRIIEDRGSKIEDRLTHDDAIFDPRSSILDPFHKPHGTIFTWVLIGIISNNSFILSFSSATHPSVQS